MRCYAYNLKPGKSNGIPGDPLTSEVYIRVLLFSTIQCTGTELNTPNIGNDIAYRLKWLFYDVFKKLSSETMKRATCICVIQCRIETNVADRPYRILWPFMLAVVLDIIYRTTQKDTGKLKSFL